MGPRGWGWGEGGEEDVFVESVKHWCGDKSTKGKIKFLFPLFFFFFGGGGGIDRVRCVCVGGGGGGKLIKWRGGTLMYMGGGGHIDVYYI